MEDQNSRVFVSLLTEEQEFQRMQADDARAAAARLGLELELEFAANSALVQIQQLFKQIHAAPERRPAAIVVESVAGEGLERVARNAVASGISWILLNWNVPYVAALRDRQRELLVASVVVDETEIGQIQARQSRALCPGGGSILCVQGPADTTTAQGRLAGLRSGLGSRFDVKLLNGDWTEESGYKAATSWLRLKTTEGTHVALVVAQNDAMAVGARRAIRTLRPDWEHVPVLGCDGLPEGGKRLVEQGELVATVVKPTTAGTAVELAAQWLLRRSRSGARPQPDIVLSPASFPPEERLRPSRAPVPPAAPRR